MPKPIGTLILFPANRGNRHTFAKDGKYPDSWDGFRAWRNDHPCTCLPVALKHHTGWMVLTHAQARERYGAKRLSRNMRHRAFMELREYTRAVCPDNLDPA